MSPERISPEDFGLKTSRPSKSSDCYSLGMVIYEIISGNVPFHEDIDFTVFVKVLKGERPRREEGFPDSLWDMMERCWMPQPSDRSGVEDVLQCLETCSDRVGEEHSPQAVVSDPRLLTTPEVPTYREPSPMASSPESLTFDSPRWGSTPSSPNEQTSPSQNPLINAPLGRGILNGPQLRTDPTMPILERGLPRVSSVDNPESMFVLLRSPIIPSPFCTLR